MTDGVPVDQDMFRRLIYFRDLGDGLQYVPRAEVERTARRWRLYQAREYYSLALSRLWALLCAWGAGQSAAGAVSVPVLAVRIAERRAGPDGDRAADRPDAPPRASAGPPAAC